jgi:hypothetical protein
MRAATMFSAVALFALAGCNPLGGVLGGGDNEANQAQANGSAGGKDPAADNVQVADAGVTSSRSFQPLAGSDGGDKVPTVAGQGFDPSLLVGRWGDFGDCSKNVIEIAADGTFRAGNGGVGAWRLDGNRLTFSGDQATITMTVQSLDSNGLTAIQPNGQLGRSQRC